MLCLLKRKKTSKTFSDFPLHVLLVFFYDSVMPMVPIIWQIADPGMNEYSPFISHGFSIIQISVFSLCNKSPLQKWLIYLKPHPLFAEFSENSNCSFLRLHASTFAA